MKQKSNVWIFMLVAYGFSWLLWIPDALIAQSIWNAPEGVKNFLAGPLNLGPWGPLFAATVVTFMYQGGAGVKNLLKRGLMTRLGKWWWVALFTFPVLIGGSLALSFCWATPLPNLKHWHSPSPSQLRWFRFASSVDPCRKNSVCAVTPLRIFATSMTG